MPVRYVNYVLDDGAKRPYKKHSGDAGWDLFVSKPCIINPGETKDIHTGIRIEMPPFLYARITGRSSSFRNYNLLINEGVIDNGYTGEILICIHNLGTELFHVERGMRLAQILFHVIEDVRWSEVDKIKTTSGKRGNAGFGSTGR